MKVSLNWLKNYIEINQTPDEISEILTTIGLEVEGMEEVESIKGGLEGVIVGKVLECGKHPNADKLSLCKVNVGGEDDLQIVCGAPNVATGQTVLVAQIGTTLYDKQGEPWKIKKGKIRGEESHGMICAEDELGLGESHDGILVLDDSIAAGTLAKEVYKVENDIVYDIGLTPNRSDATSHIGVAQDLVAYLHINHSSDVNIQLPDLASFHVDNKTRVINVEVANEKKCPRYSGLTISGVTIGPSPQWLINKLSSIGVRPISNIVDITNFVLHEYGQPLHAFDADKIDGQKILVKTLDQDTPFLALDEKERKLSEDDLMICDNNSKPMCLGGVFGGIDSGVTESTQNIFLESAHFEAEGIRMSSTKHLLRTDAAKCFEKGSDPNITIDALKRAAILIKEIAGGEISSDIVDVYPNKIEEKEIQLRYEKVNEVLGNEISVDEIHAILRAMNMGIDPVDDKSIKVRVPTNKADVLREIDLIEEILRIYGFNKIEIGSEIRSSISHSDFPDKSDLKERIRNILSSNGFCEMMNLSLIESRFYQGSYINEQDMVFINNTSNVHLNIMRPEMILSGLQSVGYNINRQQQDLKLYEFGKSFKRHNDGIEEREKFTLFLSGALVEESWNSQSKAVDFYDLKSFVELILNSLNVPQCEVKELKDSRFLYGTSLLLNNHTICTLGLLDSTFTARADVKKAVFCAEFNVESLLQNVRQQLHIDSISKFPTVRRDLAMILEENVDFQQVKDLAIKTDKKILKNVGLFDVFRDKDKVGEGKKSLAVSFMFENKEKTLKDKDVDKVIKKIKYLLENELGAQIRM